MVACKLPIKEAEAVLGIHWIWILLLPSSASFLSLPQVLIPRHSSIKFLILNCHLRVSFPRTQPATGLHGDSASLHLLILKLCVDIMRDIYAASESPVREFWMHSVETDSYTKNSSSRSPGASWGWERTLKLSCGVAVTYRCLVRLIVASGDWPKMGGWWRWGLWGLHALFSFIWRTRMGRLQPTCFSDD